MNRSRTLRAAMFVCAAILSSTVFTGCINTSTATQPANAIAVTGNWQLAAAAATSLPRLSGELSGSSTAFTGILHADGAGSCLPATVPVAVTGSADAQQNVTLSGPLAGGTLVVTGKLAANGKSLTAASYLVNGGTCSFAAATATAQTYASITGNYTGTFSDPSGQIIAITAALTQSPASDTDGNFQLSGTATLPNNPCFNSPVAVSNSQVTGGSFTLTYADATTQNSVTASGTFSTDATMLTVTSWVASGPCGADSGTGLLTHQ